MCGVRRSKPDRRKPSAWRRHPMRCGHDYHKAKGLEFPLVILGGLHHGTDRCPCARFSGTIVHRRQASTGDMQLGGLVAEKSECGKAERRRLSMRNDEGARVPGPIRSSPRSGQAHLISCCSRPPDRYSVGPIIGYHRSRRPPKLFSGR